MITEVPTSLQGEPCGQQALPYRLLCDLAVRGAAHLPNLVAGSTSRCPLSYGLYNHWDQQLLSLFLAMTLTTLIIMGIVYLRFVMPDIVIIKHRRNKYITPNDSEGWKKYEV